MVVLRIANAFRACTREASDIDIHRNESQKFSQKLQVVGLYIYRTVHSLGI
jgi:hypothetical protein